MYKEEFQLFRYKTLVQQVFVIIKDVFESGSYADKAMERVMKANKKWNVYQRSFVAETTYDIFRNWRLLTTVADVEKELSLKNMWTLFGAYLVFKNMEIPKDAVFKHCSEGNFVAKFKRYAGIRKLRESYPDYLDKLCCDELGEKVWERVASAMNEVPHTFLRVNTLKSSIDELLPVLNEKNVPVETVTYSLAALELAHNRNVFRTEEFKNGLFEVQDAVSQLVAPFLNVEPGMRVIDACAGTGGKTLHLGALMKNKGKIIALDTSLGKLAELKKRSKRAGVNIIEIKNIENSKTIKRLYGTADRVLLDVPCSGLGVLRRNPDAKWKLQLEDIERVKLEQEKIINQYTNLAKVDGLVVYATCSILPSEGEQQVKKFIQSHPNFELVAEKRYNPDVFNGDGFYMAQLKRLS